MPKVSVNVSPRELKQGKSVVDDICHTLRRFGEPIERFQFEVTENALMAENGPEVLDAMRHANRRVDVEGRTSRRAARELLERFGRSSGPSQGF